MVSFNLSDHPNKRKRFHHAVEEEEEDDQQITSQRAKTIHSLLGIELPLLTPLPLEWQRCLDIKSGQVYFYNTRTHEKTSRDPRLRRREPPANLDLELNLLCGSSERHVGDNFTEMTKVSGGIRTRDDRLAASKNSDGGGKKRRGVFLSLARSPSWLTFDGDGDVEEEEEMVTAVCKECHMLVMLCKTAPTCPNCKSVSLPAPGLDHMWSPNKGSPLLLN
ncbi:hypothetical protein DM860_017067 [Cuscuta australis]|uniref:WW domain-containing protein n=1 Tax=Cuscuta australis TaxID=267555 RepID=A0A328DNG8_9ASTE|nr:hypothetical protein DM860_017067 [Cuscuta australis]